VIPSSLIGICSLTRRVFLGPIRRSPCGEVAGARLGGTFSREAGLKGLRFHDLRHHAITELAESDASDQTIRSIAGHVSERMLGHYSHIRLEAKRRALDALSGRRTEVTSERDAGAIYGINDVTSSLSKPISNPQVVEKIGGADGVRTRDLLDAIEARSQLRYGPTVVMRVPYL
jgi:hypothetical protein